MDTENGDFVDVTWDEDVVEGRLAEDRGFAERYFALEELARTAAPGKDIAELANAIVKDDPMLAARLAASDREALRFAVKDRFGKKIQLGLLRRLDGPFRPLPELLPTRYSEADRVFADFETLSWVLVAGYWTREIWMPRRTWLTKRITAAMVGRRESSIDVYMRKGYLHRIPPPEAPLAGKVCFATDEVMAWEKMQTAMRHYEPPEAIVRGRSRRRSRG